MATSNTMCFRANSLQIHFQKSSLFRGLFRKFVAKLRARKGKNIWMMGGASIIASYLDSGAIDEFSIHVIPVMIGEGIPLVAPRHRNIPLELLSARSFSDGVVHLNYSVRF